MAFTLAFPDNTVPPIPDHAGRVRVPDLHEHFGTEEAALVRAAVLIAGNEWFDLRLYGPDGRQIADRHGLRDRIAGRAPASERVGNRGDDRTVHPSTTPASDHRTVNQQDLP